MSRKETVVLVIKHIVAIAIVAYGLIIVAVYSIPHLPLANKRTFHVMLRAQLAFDREKKAVVSGDTSANLLCLGSSVVERGVNTSLLDSIFKARHELFFATNSAAGGFFAKANLVMFRAMLEQGLHPARVVYGIFLQELNSKSTIHGNVNDEDTSGIKLKGKGFLNVIRYGPTALSPILDAPNFHIYLFALNNAFSDVRDPNFFQRLAFGENLFEKDSSFNLSWKYLEDLKGIYRLCKWHNIPFAFFNTPVRPKVESFADLPYLHRYEAYHAVEEFAIQNNIPIWNFDRPDVFDNRDFLDTYHLTSEGAEKMTRMLGEKMIKWHKGIVEQDITVESANEIRREVKDSLIRTVFHF